MTRWFTLLVLVFVVVGCREEARARAPMQKGDVISEKSVQVVGFTPRGEVVVFDGRTGAVESSVPGGGGTPRDVTVDPWRGAVWVFEENEDASGGEILFCPLEKGVGELDQFVELRPCVHAAWVDGSAALWAAPEGLWVFEDGPGGARWKVLREGAVGSSVSAPRPASIWSEDERISALTYDEDNHRLRRFDAVFGANAPILTEGVDWGESAGDFYTARYVPTSFDAGLLFDAAGGDVWVRRIAGERQDPPVVFDLGEPVERIEAAAMAGSLALVLGADALWIVPMDAVGFGKMARVWLDGEVRQSRLFFSRDIVVTANRAFVATDRGVRAIGLENSGTAARESFVDEQFAWAELRGPLGLVPDR